MKNYLKITRMALILAAPLVLGAQPASAQVRMPAGASLGRSIGSAAVASQASRLGTASRAGSAASRSIRPGPSPIGKGSAPRGSAMSGAGRSIAGSLAGEAGKYGLNPYGGGYGGLGYGNYPLLNSLLYEDSRASAEREYAKAYRDASIANAVVGLVSVVALSAQANRAPAPYATQVSSAPVQYVQEPVYEEMKVLVKDGYYESFQVWVPETVDRQTGDIIEGHHETHKRWAPPVYESRTVRVR